MSPDPPFPLSPQVRKESGTGLAGHTSRFLHLGWGQIGAMFREAINGWVDDNVPRLGASLAYYTLLSIAPLLVVVVAVAGMAFGREAVEGQIFWQTEGLLGPEGAAAIQKLIRSASHPTTGIVSSALGFLFLLLGASSVVSELSDALNTIWRVPSPPTPPGLKMLTGVFARRARSFAVVVGTGFLLLVSLLVNTAINIIGAFFESHLPIPEIVLRLSEFTLAFLVTTFLFAAIYKVLPAVRLRWTDVFVGACVTSLLFTFGKELIGLYLVRAGFASTYGAAGSLVAVLVWVYYSAQLFFLGAEFTKVYAQNLGSQRGSRPSEHSQS